MRNALILLASLVLLPVAAQAETFRIAKNGMDLEYQVVTLPDGVRHITGFNRTTNEAFSLKANRRWVWGKVGATEVSFRAPKSQAGKPLTELASR
jgi:hypothetical protein